MKLTPTHHRLAEMAGEWEGRARTWFDPAAPPDESPWRVSIEPLVGGAFLQQSHEGHIRGQAFTGQILYGYDSYRQKITAVWVDSFHMGDALMLSEGEVPEAPELVNVVGTYLDRGSGQTWRWRTIVRQPDLSHLHLLAFNISPDGQEDRAIDVALRRVV